MTTPTNNATGDSHRKLCSVERIMEMAYQAAEAQADWAMNLASDKLHARAMEKDDALRTQIAAMVEVVDAAYGQVRINPLGTTGRLEDALKALSALTPTPNPKEASE